MFGYILPEKPELKVKEFAQYKAYYCGLCKALKKEYGFTARMLLNYDFVLPAILGDAMAENSFICREERCIADPLHRRCVCNTNGSLSVAAAALVLSCYYKIADDRQDESGLKKLRACFLGALLARAYKKAKQHLPKLDETLAVQTAAQQKVEADGCTQCDKAAEATAQMTAAVFDACISCPAQQHIVQRLGYFIGKLIYILDAAEDYEKDQQKKRYNVFFTLDKAEMLAAAKQSCNLCAGEINLCYGLLTPRMHTGILDNIIYLGIPRSIAAAGTPRQAQHKHSPTEL